ncbi:aminotransferase class IV [uncultured Dialister sp.]|jgi:D-alanine transaminase|uniref:aminotransferase class IV n=1 Tax=uncultured Dialister sp. TaxID=278064 RepID=UPI0025F90CE4|nr:aminotransferase class IV [uncultured Dialister sp.]
MAGKTTIYYNHNFYYDFSKIISADDRGLQFGDGCYEWIRVFHGHPFALSYHVDRLYRSMRLLGIRPVTAPDEFTEIVEVVIEETGVTEGYVKIIVTRGEGDHDFTIPSRNALRPNVLVYAKPIDLDAIAKVQDGVKCITMADDRGHHCDILSLNQLNNMMARAEAQKKGCYDGIYIKDGIVTEATHSNVCIVKAGVIWTSPKNEYMIPGITRSLVLSRVAPTAGVTSIDDGAEPVKLTDMMNAEEVFLTNTQDGIIPVLSIDGKPIGDGKPGTVTRKIQQHYAHLMTDGLP